MARPSDAAKDRDLIDRDRDELGRGRGRTVTRHLRRGGVRRAAGLRHQIALRRLAERLQIPDEKREERAGEHRQGHEEPAPGRRVPLSDVRAHILSVDRAARRNERLRPDAIARLDKGEDRGIAADRHGHPHRIVLPLSGIVLGQGAAQAAGLDPHDRIGLRIEIRRATERLDGNGVALQLGAPAFDRPLDDEAQESGELRRGAEDIRRKDAGEASANRRDGLLIQPFVVLDTIAHRGPFSSCPRG